MKSSQFLFSSFLPHTTLSPCSQISARELFDCLLGRVESPFKSNVGLFPRDLVRYGCFDGWQKHKGKRTGVGVSSKLWHGSTLGGKRKRVLPNHGEWILWNLVLPQRLGTRTRELFKVVDRVNLLAPITSSQAWEALGRDEGGSAAVEIKIGRVNAASAQGTADLVTDNKRAQFGRHKG
ncbi:hypothetical protein V6N13_001007 [Hibiscus sabdariffa]